MLQVITSGERYHVENDWLSTYWHFSFDHYRDPKNISFGLLRVFNDDVVAAAGGFPFHPHREMEIVTYVIEGQLEHRDTMGNRGVIAAGEVQRMTAGTGVRHSEFNPSGDKPTPPDPDVAAASRIRASRLRGSKRATRAPNAPVSFCLSQCPQADANAARACRRSPSGRDHLHVAARTWPSGHAHVWPRASRLHFRDRR